VDRATAFVMGACMWNVEKIVRKGDYNYAVVRNHPNAIKFGYVLHHRVVVENHLNRLLNSHEIVHHKNGDKLDNDIGNLEILSASAHTKMHRESKGRQYVYLICPQCGKKFHRERRQTHLTKGGLYTTCSASCRGKFSRFIQIHGKTNTVENAISGNILNVYVKFALDNSEETLAIGIRRDYTHSACNG
jgi:hypothetical protein